MTTLVFFFAFYSWLDTRGSVRNPVKLSHSLDVYSTAIGMLVLEVGRADGHEYHYLAMHGMCMHMAVIASYSVGELTPADK